MAKTVNRKRAAAKRGPAVREIRGLRAGPRSAGRPRPTLASCTSGGILSCNTGCNSGEV